MNFLANQVESVTLESLSNLSSSSSSPSLSLSSYLICTGSSRFCDALLRSLFTHAPTSPLNAENIGCNTLQLLSSLEIVLSTGLSASHQLPVVPRCNLGLMYSYKGQPPFCKVGTILKGHLNSRTFGRIDFGLNCSHGGQTLLSCDIFFTVSKENKCTDSGARPPGFISWLGYHHGTLEVTYLLCG